MSITLKSFLNRPAFNISCPLVGLSSSEVKEEFSRREGIPLDLQRLWVGNRYVSDEDVVLPGETAYVCFSLPGGKGGFGSMLRAIGAQIEKTTNREACRDLSGRRLRDINEEKRLKEWISKQAEREHETIKRRKEKLERMRLKPKHEFDDPEYDQERSELHEKVVDSVMEGLKKAPDAPKRKATAPPANANKKTCLWLGLDDLEVDDSDSSNESDEENMDKKTEKSSEKHSKETDCASKGKGSTLDLSQFENVQELQTLGEEVLSSALSTLGAKCGGTLEQKAERLWALKGKGTLKKLNGPADIVL